MAHAMINNRACAGPQVIGRVARLTQLNGADVKPRERRDAELRYLQVPVTLFIGYDTYIHQL